MAAARAAANKKASDIAILDVSELIGVTDLFVICSAPTPRQVKTIVDEIVRSLRDIGVRPYSLEGQSAATWVLLDYLDFVVHVFRDDERKFYDLERLWRDAPRIVVDDVAQEVVG